VLGDWHGIALVPPLAVVAPILAGVGFFIVGAGGFGFSAVFSESLLIMGVLIALGAFATQLGVVGLVGFALGEFLVGNRRWSSNVFDQTGLEDLIRTRLPLVITYLLMAVAVVVIPRLGKNLALGIGRWRRIPTSAAWLISTPIVLVVSWIGLRTWAALAPTLIRPRFVWSGGAPTVEAIQVFQEQDNRLVAIGVAATLARQLVVAIFIYWPKMAKQLSALEDRAHLRVRGTGDFEAPKPPTAARRFGADVLSALLASIVLSGILETRLRWFSVFAVFLLIRLLRSNTIHVAMLDQWKQQAARIPVVLRLGILWFGAILVRSMLSNDLIGSYRGMAFFVLGGVVIAFMIFPGEPRTAPPNIELDAEQAVAP